MGIALIMLMAGFIKICSVHTPTNNPKLPPAKSLPGKKPVCLKKNHQHREVLTFFNHHNLKFTGNAACTFILCLFMYILVYLPFECFVLLLLSKNYHGQYKLFSFTKKKKSKTHVLSKLIKSFIE